MSPGWWRELTRPRSLSGNAVIRFAGTVAATAFMAATGILVARTTGTDGKGAVATLSYLIAVAGPLATLGLGDAAIVLIRREGWASDRAAAAAIWPTVALSVVAGLLVWGIALLLPDLAEAAGWSLPLVVVGVVGFALQRALTGLGEAFEHIPFTSVAYVVFAAVTTVATFVLVTVVRLDVPGAVVALVAGPAAGTAMLAVFLGRRRVGPRPETVLADVRRAARLGVPMELAQLIRTLASRVDVLVVYVLLGVSAAGLYSVALTVGEVVRYAPGALAVAAFPAVAKEPLASAHVLARRVTRTTVAAGLVATAVLAAVVPWAIPLLFGRGFTASVTPALVLLVSGAIGSAQWGVCRLAAAVGRPEVLLRSHAVSLVVMLAFDAWLVPAYGLVGAAVASAIAPLAGVGMAVRDSRDVFAQPVTSSWFVPTRTEVETLAAFPRRFVSAVRDAGR